MRGYAKRAVIVIGIVVVIMLAVPKYVEAIQASSEPNWVSLFTDWNLPHLVPDNKRVRELEALRGKYEIPDDTFALRILGSPSTTRKLQRHILENLSIQNPGASEKDLLRMALISRLQAPPSTEMTAQEIDRAMKDINSFDDLCDYILSLDEEKPDLSDPLGIGKRIDEILAQEEVDRKALAGNLIRSLGHTYSDLKSSHPDQDEHWFLANTWLERYGDSEESKHKGPEFTRFTAYKDTHPFSVLEPPKSIRGLVLFLVYKELGEQCSIYYGSEFRQIMQPVTESIQDGTFLTKYKRRNPQTWREAETIKSAAAGASLDLHSYLMGVDSLQYSGGRDLLGEILGMSKRRRYDKDFVEAISSVTLTMIDKAVSVDFLKGLLELADRTLYKEFSKSGENALKKAKLEVLLLTMFITANTCLANEVPYEVLDRILFRLYDSLTERGMIAKGEDLVKLSDLFTDRSVSYTDALQNQSGSGPMWHFGKLAAKNIFGEAIDRRFLDDYDVMRNLCFGIAELLIEFSGLVKRAIDKH